MRIALIGTTLGLSTAFASAAPTLVNDYNWLNLRPDKVTPFISGQPLGGSGNGTPTDFRWGGFVWIPDGTLTNSGAGTYYAGLQLDKAREVETVSVQWWANEGTSITSFAVEGSTDGTTFSQIGTHNYGSPQTGTATYTNVDVTDGDYKAIRLRMDSGGYTYGNAARGGPGIFAIEPFGDGSVNNWEVNWANQPNFSTTVSNNGLDFNGNGYVNQLLYDRGFGRAGDETWAAGDYMQIDLQSVRLIDSVVGVWEYVWAGTAFDVTYSLNGVNFFTPTGMLAPTSYGSGAGALGYTFDPTSARYVRISNATGGGPYELFNQILVYGIPEPTALSALAMGAVLLIRRRA